MDQINEVLEKAEALFADRRKHKELLSFLSEQKLRALKSARLYEIKGRLLRRGGMNARRKRAPRALKAFTQAIKLDEGNAALYRERGITWRFLPDFDNALKDHSIAITINPKDPRSFVARADTLRMMKRFKDASSDYSKAMLLDPLNPQPYYRRRYLWMEMKHKQNEIKDFAKALELDKEAKAEDYVDLGDLYYAEKKYDMAFRQYNIAINMDPQVWLGYEYDFLSLPLVNIFNALGSISGGRKIEIYRACMPIARCVDMVLEMTSTEHAGGSVVHFTKLPVADILLSGDDVKFRYYHVSYMNDPEEGKILLDILDEPIIRESFSRGGLHEDNNFYLGSFLPESQADELVMWRTYGKDEHDGEAKGCSIIIDRDFFEADAEIRSRKAENKSEAQKGKGDSADEGKSRVRRGLSAVIYYDKVKREILGEDSDDIKKELRKLRVQLTRILRRYGSYRGGAGSDAIKQAIDRVVYYVITVLRYSFKSSDYAYEKEERVIWEMRPESDLVKIDEGGNMPKRLYVEAKKPIRKYIRGIVLGPRVIQPDRWLYLKVKAIKGESSIQLKKSQCKFQ